MLCHLTLTELAFRQLVDGLTDNPTRIAACPAGVSRLPDRVEFLVHTVRWQPAGTVRLPPNPSPPQERRPPDVTAPHVFVLGADNAAHLTHALHTALSRCPADTTNAFLALGIGAATGHLAGICHTPHGAEPLRTLTLIGAGLHAVRLSDPFPMTNAPSLDTGHWALDIASERWSRTLGALGSDTYHRLAALHPCLIGCGRSGSLVATALTRFGGQRLTLIDPDLLEPHNLGEMDAVPPADLGRPKVDAVADRLRTQFPNFPISQFPVPDSILSLSALVAVKRADLLICCVDNPTARLVTTFLAALYLKPLLDIGTGIFYDATAQDDSAPSPSRLGFRNPPSPIPNRTMGADVRLLLPSRCLLCFGGIANLDRARVELLSDSPIHRFTDSPIHRFVPSGASAPAASAPSTPSPSASRCGC